MQPNQSIVLVFPTVKKLWTFAQTIHVDSMEINPTKCMLICECSQAEIEMALEFYEARVLRDFSKAE